ncbi:hypothetical protein AGABI2DRAFT_194016 [Agaricus bisporus var. bisporus H97]|uniref:hypothetical protein n=1 Tax=Agaricus bisporus var. bisporus (strain H97 / ATCC MYA-4626 / FGSC 10389) TaxID=936046 RepID=UPI00029F6008|nr:hypothetical protein AGABI2DRAFT_194016 [Agaricus bisporus var. bisporus H97]EKV46154.1 hypothetical protein AGABI2DRAFT_194016 [Agaricus bisporus var. bisporus H97]
MEPAPDSTVDRTHPMNYSRSLGKSFTFVASLVLSVVAWFICIVSQSYVTDRVGNDAIGTLWFGIILQLGVIIAIVICFLGESLFQYGITISIFAALATSYGAEGVHRNIFHSPTDAQKAVSAGWIITCIVNVIWILILSCEPTSYVYQVVANNGRANSWQSNGIAAPHMDAFSHKYAEGVPNTLPLQSLGPDGAAGPGAGYRGSGVRGSGGDQESHRRRSAGVWTTPPQTPGGAGSMREMPPVPEFTPNGHPMDHHEVGSGTRGSGSNLDQARPPSSLPTTTDATPAPQPITRAKALFEYNASPTDPSELTFARGEVLEIFDKSGKWWEAMKSNGARGIAPSNYLEII